MDKMIDQMIETYDRDNKSHWHGLLEGYREGMMNGIVGFEKTVTRLQGKYKLNQNLSHTDHANFAHALLQSNTSDSPGSRHRNTGKP